ncbi:MAG: hypothetical protein STHCBS139747_002088 [Sporothrix thermara]
MASTTHHLPQFGLYIANEFTASTCPDKLTLINPFDDTVVADNVPVAAQKDIDHAVSVAKDAFLHGPWATFTGAQRAACLNRFADLVERDAERLAYAESLPSGKPISGILHFDLAHMAQVYRYYAGWADKIAGESFAEDNGFAKIVRYEPLGVCAGIASWNATFMYIGWKLAPALAAGNTVIFKPSEKSPLGTLALAPLYAEAGFPPGVVQFLTGARETGSLLASHMDIAKISFTGSIAGGKAVQEAATRSNLKKVTLELGGKSAAVVFDDANFDQTVEGICGFLANSGQICVAASRLLVQRSIADKLIAAIRSVFAEVAKKMCINPLEPAASYGPVVDKAQFDRVMSYIDKGKTAAKLVAGGKRMGDKGCFIEPTLFVDSPTDSPIWTEEIFGPVLAVRTFDTEEEAVRLANDSLYGLVALHGGGVSVNSPYLPELNTPFGGTKQSGQGRELGSHGLYSYLEPKAVHIR